MDGWVGGWMDGWMAIYRSFTLRPPFSRPARPLPALRLPFARPSPALRPPFARPSPALHPPAIYLQCFEPFPPNSSSNGYAGGDDAPKAVGMRTMRGVGGSDRQSEGKA